MGFCITSRKDIDDLLDKHKLSDCYENYEDYPFLPVGLLVDELEKRKKKGSVLPLQLMDKLENLPKQIISIPLTSYALAKALQNNEFVEKFVNSKTNPFALMSEACIYDDSVSSWADMDILFDSLHQIEWP